METLGEKRVRKDFNVSQSPGVDMFKNLAASAINDLETSRVNVSGEVRSDEVQRLISIAQTKFEEAAMWAVKAVTGE